MRKMSGLRIVSWFLVSLIASRCWGQNPSPNANLTKPSSGLSKLATEKIDITRLDLVLLTARIRLLEQALAHPQARNESVVGMEYDKTSGRVIIKSWVEPSWSASANLQSARKELTEQAASYCADGLLMAIAEQGVLYVATVGPANSFCEVDFFTWGNDAKGQIEARDIAVFEDGQIRLK
jgi:hypothetical protein